jgi:hypothetical protein
MSLFQAAMIGLGSSLASKGIEAAYDKYIAPTTFGGFLGDFNIFGSDVGEMAGTVAKGLGEAIGTEFKDLPDVSSVEVPRSGGNTAGTFSAGKVANVPLGSSNRVPDAIGRANVQKSIISRVQTVGLPRPQTAAPTIKLGSSQVQKIKRARA